MPPKNASGTNRKTPLGAADPNVVPATKIAAKGKMASATSSAPAAKTYGYSDSSSVGFHCFSSSFRY